MSRWIWCVGVVLAAVAGCDRHAAREAQAMSAVPRAPASAEALARPVKELVPEASLAGVLPDTTLAYVRLPDVAAMAALIQTSPLRRFWDNPEAQRMLHDLLGARAMHVLSREAEKVMAGLARGTAELAVGAPRMRAGAVRCDVYFVWRAGAESEAFVRSLADLAAALKSRALDGALSERDLGGIALRTLTFGSHDALDLHFAAVRDEVRISTDIAFFTDLAGGDRTLRRAPSFAAVMQGVAQEGAPLACAYVNLGAVLRHAAEAAARFAPAGALPEHLWDALGSSGIGAAGFAAYRHGGQVRESVFVEWPEKERGLATPFLRRANVRGALALAPAQATSFTVVGVDWHNAWHRLLDLVGEVSAPAGGMLREQVRTWERTMDIEMSSVLKAFGEDLIVYGVRNAAQAPVTVAVLSVEHRETLRGLAAAIEKRLNQRLLVESVDAVPVYGIPGPLPLRFALCEQVLAVSSDMEALRDFVMQRRGRAQPLAGRSEVKDFLLASDMAGLSYVDLGKELPVLARAGTLTAGSGQQAAIGRMMSGVLDATPVDIGGVWTSLYIFPQGIKNEIRSGCGMLPFAVSTGALALGLGVPAAFEAARVEKERSAIAAIHAVVTGQEEFRVHNSRYARNLWELYRNGNVGSDLGRGHAGGYLFKLRVSGDMAWGVEARPVSGRGRHFYCDHTGTVRVEIHRPANVSSPVLRDGVQ